MSDKSVIIEGNRPPAGHPVDRAAAGEVAIACYDTVPPFLAAELDELYHHINSSLRHYAVARKARSAHAYVARRGSHPLAIFLFQRSVRSVMVFNEMMQVPPEEIERFAAYVFGHFPSVSRISFSKIGRAVGPLSLPWQQYGHAEDIVVPLPGTVDAYLARLGAKTRYNIRRQTKAICADFPGLSFETYENGGIAAHHVAGLIDLKKANMEEKRIRFGITPEETAWIMERARTNGLLIVALHDGKVCGGSLSFCLGEHYFAHVNGYDRRFAAYSLGMLCCYVAMKETIRRGAKEAHLSWGRNQYKFKLLGVAREMANLDIYRSRGAYCRHLDRVARNKLRDAVATHKQRLLDYAHRSGLLPSLASRIVKALRRLKRASFRPAD